MACKAVAALLAALLIGFFSPVTPAKTAHDFRATLARVHQHPGNYSAAARRDARRVALLSYRRAAGGAPTTTTRTTSTVSASSRRGLLEALADNSADADSYHMSLSLGTPPQAIRAIIDTGSDLTWTFCAPCTACFAQVHPTPLYDPSRSSTFSKLPCASPLCQVLSSSERVCNATGCVYDYHYAVGFTAGYLAADTLAIGDASFANVAFGCSTANDEDMSGASGIVGLGRSALSLLSQLGVGRFSYCLRSGTEAGASPILFGALAKVTGDKVQSTPLVQNPVTTSAFYYVNLTGIAVGSTELPVNGSTFGFTADGEGGVIVDSGTTFTYLAEAGYAMLREAFLSQTAGLLTTVSGAEFDLDLCFEATAGGAADVPVPRLVFRFEGGAEYVVPRHSYFNAVDERGSVACLLVLPTSDVSVIGSVMQMDLHVLYDLVAETFSFAPANCASL